MNYYGSTTVALLSNKKEEKRKEEKEIKKYGEYQNVFLDDLQFEKLKADFPNDYSARIQKLDDYMQSTGKKYKDCLATIRNWARKDGYKFPTKEKQEVVKTIEVDTREMTQEEYMQIVRGEKNV